MKKRAVKNLEVLKNCASKVLDKCKINVEICIDACKIPFTLHMPSGDMKYRSF